jgi:hypothetical protein
MLLRSSARANEINTPATRNRLRASSGPTLKRTEGRASVWGSEFTSKDLTKSI